MKKIYQFLGKAEVVISATCFSLSLLIIFTSAIARTFKHPLNWSQDMSLFLFAWGVFLSADAAIRVNKLINIDLLVSRLPQNIRKTLEVVVYTIIFIFLIFLFYNGIKLTIFSSRRAFQGIPGFSYSWVIVSIPVGSLLQMITIILKIRNLYKREEY
ncbi:MAG: TRAP transporter small permease [Spirochaetales bacterium]|nr:TRAP transporter small permease [Spirochaetales bacterium]